LFLRFDCLVIGATGFPVSPPGLQSALPSTAGIEKLMLDVFLVAILTPRAGVLPMLDETHVG
jgi:hypothetical protein